LRFLHAIRQLWSTLTQPVALFATPVVVPQRPFHIGSAIFMRMRNFSGRRPATGELSTTYDKAARVSALCTAAPDKMF
jgi:hypothetical protein